jgi:hypothetical protein
MEQDLCMKYMEQRNVYIVQSGKKVETCKYICILECLL